MWSHMVILMIHHDLHPPVPVITDPEHPISSLEAAATYVEQHCQGHLDVEATNLVRQLTDATTASDAKAAAEAFRDWAESAGLLLTGEHE
jgi:hypothetical protein